MSTSLCMIWQHQFRNAQLSANDITPFCFVHDSMAVALFTRTSQLPGSHSDYHF